MKVFDDETGQECDSVGIKDMLRCPIIALAMATSLASWTAAILAAVGSPHWKHVAEAAIAAFALTVVWGVHDSA